MYLAIDRPRLDQLLSGHTLFKAWWIIAGLSCIGVAAFRLFQNNFAGSYAATCVLATIIMTGLFHDIYDVSRLRRPVRWLYASLCVMIVVATIALAV